MTSQGALPITPVAPRLHDAARDWMTLPGGELEAPRPRAMCYACLQRLRQGAAKGCWPERPRTLCFGCYRAQLDRDRRLRAAANIDTASEARFQTTLPFEPVNRIRLDQLRADRRAAREAASRGAGQYVDRRRRAQIAARHALERVVAGLKARNVEWPARPVPTAASRTAAVPLPDAWLPFVGSR